MELANTMQRCNLYFNNMEKYLMNVTTTRTAFLIPCVAFVVSCATQTVEPKPEPIKEKVAEVIKVEPVPIVKVEVPPPPVIVPKPIVEEVVRIEPKPPTEMAIVYFDFDSSDLSDEAKNIIATHTKFLQENPGYTVTLEGHADARGEDEYNEILGSQRAMAIKEILISENINENQINLVSYGERRPAVEEESPSAWRSNRRAIFLYSKGLNQNAQTEPTSSEKMMVLDQ